MRSPEPASAATKVPTEIATKTAFWLQLRQQGEGRSYIQKGTLVRVVDKGTCYVDQRKGRQPAWISTASSNRFSITVDDDVEERVSVDGVSILSNNEPAEVETRLGTGA